MKTVASFLMVALSVPAFAGVIRHDLPDSQYKNFANDSRFSGVGLIAYDTPGTCSGTVIHKNWVMTAAHCLEDAQSMSFYLPSDTGWRFYEASNWVAHENYAGAGLLAGWDIGLIHFDSDFDVAPAQLYSGDSELFSPMIGVGFGMTGTGLSGQVSMDYTRRAGTNSIDDLWSSQGDGGQIMWSDFDHPTDPSFNYMNYPQFTFDDLATPLEIMLAPGDSGGGIFVEENGNTYIAGVFSFSGDSSGDGLRGSYGDSFGSTRVSSFTNWINNKIFAVPEPAPWWLSILGFAALYLRRRQSRA